MRMTGDRLEADEDEEELEEGDHVVGGVCVMKVTSIKHWRALKNEDKQALRSVCTEQEPHF